MVEIGCLLMILAPWIRNLGGENLIEIWEKYKKELEEVKQELKIVPEGFLSKRGRCYYHSIGRKDTGITRKTDVICQLCRKRYLLARKEQLRYNLSLAPETSKDFDKRSAKELIAAFPSAYQGLPENYFFLPSINDFLTKSYTKNPYQPENLTYSSNNGTPVRSKSEVLIANQLENYHIPYRYEIAITLGKKTIYPDFIIKNPFTGKTIIWEHFGALNQEGYEQKMNDKMGRYLKHGYIPFETIIYTFEFDVKHPPRLQTLIQQIILQQ